MTILQLAEMLRRAANIIGDCEITDIRSDGKFATVLSYKTGKLLRVNLQFPENEVA